MSWHLQHPTLTSWVVENQSWLLCFWKISWLQRRIADLTQYWSKSDGSTFHEPSRHWIQRTMFGRCPRQQSGNLLDAKRFKVGKWRGNKLCLDHRWRSARRWRSNLVDLQRGESSEVICREMAWVLMRWCWQLDPQFRPKTLWVTYTNQLLKFSSLWVSVGRTAVDVWNELATAFHHLLSSAKSSADKWIEFWCGDADGKFLVIFGAMITSLCRSGRKTQWRYVMLTGRVPFQTGTDPHRSYHSRIDAKICTLDEWLSGPEGQAGRVGRRYMNDQTASVKKIGWTGHTVHSVWWGHQDSDHQDVLLRSHVERDCVGREYQGTLQSQSLK